MNQRTRKLLGIFALVGILIAYTVGAGAIYAAFLGGQPWWVLILYFAIAGMLWFFPAAWMIRWMVKEDAER